MNQNGQFREEELVSRKVKVGNEWQTKTFPIIGGRLRILHENNDHTSIQTEVIRLDNDFVVIKAMVENQRGSSMALERRQPKETPASLTHWWSWPKPEPSLGRFALAA